MGTAMKNATQQLGPRWQPRAADLQHIVRNNIPVLGLAEFPGKEPVVIPDPKSPTWDWVVLRIEDDPIYQRRELNIPAPIRQRLTDLEAANVRFDSLLIAHEIPKDTRIRTKQDLLTALAPAPSPDVKRVDRTVNVIRAVATGFAQGVGAVALAAGAALVADPVLIGAISADGKCEPGTPCLFFTVARW